MVGRRPPCPRRLPAGDRGLPGIPGGNRRKPIAATGKNQQGFRDRSGSFYGTNRAPTGGRQTRAVLTARKRGELQYGYLNVTIPADPQRSGARDPAALGRIHICHERGVHEAPLRAARSNHAAGERRLRAPPLRQQIKDSPSKDLFILRARIQQYLRGRSPPPPPRWPTTWISTVRRSSTAGRRRAGVVRLFFCRRRSRGGHQRPGRWPTFPRDRGGSIRCATHPCGSPHSMGQPRIDRSAGKTYLAKRATRQGANTSSAQIVFTAPDVDRDYFVDANRIAARQPLNASTL